MPPDALPPNDEREPAPADANVVDPEVLAERRAQRAEHAERSATRRAADAQTLAAELARERARLEAERDAARAEAAAAREGADVVKSEARHVQAERDALRGEVETLRAELARAREQAAAPSNGNGHANGQAGGPPAAWAAGLRRELAVARGAAARPALAVVAASRPTAAAPMPALERERGLVARRVSVAPGPAFGRSPLPSAPRPGERATPATALALERERSSRLQAQLERAAAIERELREQVAALQRAVDARREAEERIEAALRRVRSELESAQEIEMRSALAPSRSPVVPAVATQAPAVGSVGLAIDAGRLNAARDRLRAEGGEQLEIPKPALVVAPPGPPSAWLPNALRRLTRDDPRTAGRILAGLLPAQGIVARRALRYDLVLAERGCVAVDLEAGNAHVRPREEPRPRREVDLRVASDEAGLARLLLGRRSFVRRRARVRGRSRHLRELRRMTREPLALHDLARAGTTLDPVLTLMLTALAVDASDTFGHRFTIAHAPLPGGAPDAWLRIQDGRPLAVVRRAPAEEPAVTIRSTRGGLLPALAGVEPPRGEAAAIDGDADKLALLRGWIARTEARGA